MYTLGRQAVILSILSEQIGRYELGHRPADHLLGTKAEDLPGPGIPTGNYSIHALPDDRVVGRLDDGRQAPRRFIRAPLMEKIPAEQGERQPHQPNADRRAQHVGRCGQLEAAARFDGALRQDGFFVQAHLRDQAADAVHQKPFMISHQELLCRFETAGIARRDRGAELGQAGIDLFSHRRHLRPLARVVARSALQSLDRSDDSRGGRFVALQILRVADEQKTPFG